MCALGSGFMPLRLSTLTKRKTLEFDLYQEIGGKPRLFKSKSFPLLSIDIISLRRRGCDVLYVPMAQKEYVIKSMTQNMPNILKDDSIPLASKMDMMTQISESILSDIMKSPESQKSIKLVVKQCENQISFALLGDDARREMIRKSSEAPYPVAHAITVSHLSILLGLKCGLDNPEDLHALGVGALLHEIGKTVIDKNYYLRAENRCRITNNRLKKYPQIGMSMLKKMDFIPQSALKPILEHQERLDGSGFPRRLKASDISFTGRIVAICDAYDESLHPIQKSALPTPFQVLKTMKVEQKKYDEEILIQFIKLLGESWS